MRQFATVNFPNFPVLQQWAMQPIEKCSQRKQRQFGKYFFGRKGQINYMRCRTGILQVSFFHIFWVVKNKPKRNEQKNYLQVARCFPSENEKQNIFRKSCSLQVKDGTLTKHDDFLQC